MITKKKWGLCEQGEVDAYTLDNRNGLRVTVLTLGGTLQKIEAFGVDVILGFDTLEEYIKNAGYFGAIVGRVANRIAGAELTVDGISYSLSKNRKDCMIHGGHLGFDKRVWDASAEGNCLVLRLRSQDGEEGFPGAVDVSVVYSLDEENGLHIDYRAVPDKKTPINLTSHAYFNLNGGGNVQEHRVWLDADRYTATDSQGIPTGELPSVEDTPLDFREEKNLVGGIDHNYCLKGSGLRHVAHVRGDHVAMDVETTTEGLQLYCDAFRTPKSGKNGSYYVGNCYFCMECQGYPDAVHHENFPSILVKAGDEYRQTTVYRFRAC